MRRHRQGHDGQAGVLLFKQRQHLVDVEDVRDHVPEVADERRTRAFADGLDADPDLAIGSQGRITIIHHEKTRRRVASREQ